MTIRARIRLLRLLGYREREDAAIWVHAFLTEVTWWDLVTRWALDPLP